MDWLGIILIAASFALGGVLKGATGAGSPIIGVPLVSLLYDVPTAVAVFTLPNLISNVWQGWHYRMHRAPAALTWGFAGAGAVGAAIGSVLLVTLSADVLILAVAVAVLFYIAFRILRPDWSMSLAVAERLAVAVGLLGGILQGVAGISAPVSIGFLNAIRMPRDAFIATISIFFAAMTIVQIVVLAASGVLTFDRVLVSAVAILPLLGGMPVGAYLARHVSREAFDRTILILLALIALRLAGAVLA